MTNNQAISKCNKKAWEEIKRIKAASNMLEIQQSISDAIEKTFGYYNEGLLMIRMRKLGQMGELEHIMRIRRVDYNNFSCLVRNYLIDMIPVRFYNTLLYRQLTNQIA